MLKGKDNKITAIDGTGSSVGIIAAWVHKLVLGVETRRRVELWPQFPCRALCA